MTAIRKKLLTLFLCLCICLSVCGLVPVEAFADTEISKVLTTLSNVPVAMDGVYSITAATSTEGCYLTSYGWYDSNGSPADGTFESGTYRVEITVEAADGYYFSDGVEVYLNNSGVEYVMNGSGSLTLYRDYSAQLWAPTITKHPTSENVEVGELASFVAIASYADTYKWTATSPDGKTTCDCEDLPDLFPGVSIGGDGKEKMNIRNVPAEMDGWTVKCTFSGPGGSAVSNSATVNVKTAATPKPTETPKPSATPEPSATPDTEDTEENGKDSNHVHAFSSEWSMDEDKHWKECSCGERTEEGQHSMEWLVITPATKKAEGTERGLCSVCGYLTTRSIEYVQEDDGIGFMRYVLYGIILVVVLIVIGLVISSAAERRRRERRRRNRNRRDRY